MGLSRLTIWPLVVCLGLCSSCGGSSGLSGAEIATRAAITAAAALALAAADSRGRSRREGRLEDDEADDAFATGRPWVPPTPTGPEPLPLWRVTYRADVQAEDLWCVHDEDCVLLTAVDCCACDAGGTALAVNRSAAPRLAAELAAACEGAPCENSQVDASCAARIGCRNDLCRLFRDGTEDGEAAPGPTVELPPVPPPPGS